MTLPSETTLLQQNQMVISHTYSEPLILTQNQHLAYSTEYSIYFIYFIFDFKHASGTQFNSNHMIVQSGNVSATCAQPVAQVAMGTGVSNAAIR